MVKISLGNGLFSIIDDEDYDLVSEYTWSLNSNNYAITKLDGCTIFQHRLIMSPPKDMVVDHIDGDRLDNRKSNLRICTQAENMRNRLKYCRTTTSKYKGVSSDKNTDKWLARIRVNNIKYGLGWYPNEYDAALAYNVGSLLLNPKFGKLNDINAESHRILSKTICLKLLRHSKLDSTTTINILKKHVKKGIVINYPKGVT